MTLKFPYQTRYSPVFGAVPLIKLKLQIKGANSIEPIVFLLDTGAEISSLPSLTAAKLGIDLKKCPKIDMKGYENTIVRVYLAKIKIIFGNITFSIPCVFHPDEKVPILLGRAGILNKFTILLDAKQKVAEFKEI